MPRVRSETTAVTTTPTTSPTRPCTPASSAAERRSTSCPATARSSSRSATCRSTIPTHSSPTSAPSRERFLPSMRGVAAGHAHRVRRPFVVARFRHARRIRYRVARWRLQPERRARQGFVRHGSEPVPQRGDPGDHLRAGPHCAGAPAERMGRARPARALRGVHAPPGRPRLRERGRCPRRRSRSPFPISRAGPTATPGFRMSGPSLGRDRGRMSSCRR